MEIFDVPKYEVVVNGKVVERYTTRETALIVARRTRHIAKQVEVRKVEVIYRGGR